jgi:hypothetical protein
MGHLAGSGGARWIAGIMGRKGGIPSMRGWRVRLLCDWTEGASWAIQSLRVFRQELVCWPRRLSTCHNHDGSAEPAPTPLGPHSITSKACQLFGRYLAFHVCTPDFIVSLRDASCCIRSGPDADHTQAESIHTSASSSRPFPSTSN